MNWAKAWREYIDGNVVSQHAVRLIQTFLVNICCIRDQYSMKPADCVDDSDVDAEIPALKLNEEDARQLLYRDSSLPANSCTSIGKTTKRRNCYAEQHDRAIRISVDLWSSNAVRSASATVKMFECSGTWKAVNYKQLKLDKGKQYTDEHTNHLFEGLQLQKLN